MSALELLPLEIWKKVISRVNDPKKLVKLRLVCNLFDQLIEIEMKKNKQWKELLPSDMKMWINNILAKKYPFKKLSKLELLPNLWKEAFFSYKNWRLFGDKSRKIHSFRFNVSQFLQNEKITCLTTFARFVAVGTNLGLIFFYKIGKLKNFFWAAKHGNNLTKIQFWYQGKNNILALSTSSDRVLKFWNVSQKKSIVTPHYNATNIQAHCAVFRGDNGPRNNFLTMYSENEKLIVMTTYDTILRVITLKVPDPQGTELTEINKKLYRLLPRRPPVDLALIPNNELRLFKNGKFFTIIFQGWPNFPIYEYKLYRYEYIFVTSIAMHVHLLIFGLNTGQIHIYSIKNNFQLMEQPLEFCEVRKLNISDSPILALSLTETKSRRYIIAATEVSIHSIYLGKKKSVLAES
ncbi:uncharacterized protein LOC123264824 isoform X2 [Cotesia glomerata]|uniref:uncharacterized protein LOC123264824 isoform X2 n=1 Tax=Cotesia glomerata TaxID=32391 RepID=UPI001D02BFA6|nr:uncharacterized protein LOC123264824 isoform X2 [Cotesia glomerata]